PYTSAAKPAPLGATHDPVGFEAALLKLMACPDLASRRWIFDQYDSTVGGQTVKRPAQADAAIVRLDGTNRALAITTDCTPRYCAADAQAGGAQAVAEAWRNITATGALPLAVTDNMNFGNPEKPEIMGQFVDAIKGMAAACTALDFPVVSGNVSLYNETEGKGILPTPAIGAVGVIEDASLATGLAIAPGQQLILIGDTKGALGQSLWLREILGREDGAPPEVSLLNERENGDFVREHILNGAVQACHDLSDGGLAIALVEMALAGDTGITLHPAPEHIPAHAYWFGEDQARYVLAVTNPTAILTAAHAAGIPARHIGHTGGNSLTLTGANPISLATLRDAHEGFFPNWFA
ncbi:MAG: AIR synthase related protein, partial [Acidocella sp.]|nr:AIR synthase related protein [Acidocella sp.]